MQVVKKLFAVCIKVCVYATKIKIPICIHCKVFYVCRAVIYCIGVIFVCAKCIANKFKPIFGVNFTVICQKVDCLTCLFAKNINLFLSLTCCIFQVFVKCKDCIVFHFWINSQFRVVIFFKQLQKIECVFCVEVDSFVAKIISVVTACLPVVKPKPCLFAANINL